MTPDGINIGALKNVSFDKGDFEIDDPNDIIRTFSLYGRAQYAYMEGHESASSACKHVPYGLIYEHAAIYFVVGRSQSGRHQKMSAIHHILRRPEPFRYN